MKPRRVCFLFSRFLPFPLMLTRYAGQQLGHPSEDLLNWVLLLASLSVLAVVG